MKAPKSVKKCSKLASKAARRFGPGIFQAALDKCLRKSGVSLDGVRRRSRKSRRKGRR